MSLKSRLRRLDAGVRWLETEGVVRRAELTMKLVQTVQAIADHKAGDRRFAAQWKKNIPSLPLPKPRVRARRSRPRPARPPDAGQRSTPPPPALVPAVPMEVAHPPPPRPPKPRWTKNIRPGPYDVLTWEEVLQVPWVDSSAEDDGS